MSLHLLLLDKQVVTSICVRFLLYSLVQPLPYIVVPVIFRVPGSFLSSFEVSHELSYKAIEFMEVDVCQYWREYTSYKVANILVEFSTSIPRTQLRPGYGDGFLGAPLQTGQRPERPRSQQRGGRRGTSSTHSNTGDSHHV